MGFKKIEGEKQSSENDYESRVSELCQSSKSCGKALSEFNQSILQLEQLHEKLNFMIREVKGIVKAKF